MGVLLGATLAELSPDSMVLLLVILLGLLPPWNYKLLLADLESSSPVTLLPLLEERSG
jgi:hypothetical protein